MAGVKKITEESLCFLFLRRIVCVDASAYSFGRWCVPDQKEKDEYLKSLFVLVGTTVSSTINSREKSRFLPFYYSYSWTLQEVRNLGWYYSLQYNQFEGKI